MRVSLIVFGVIFLVIGGLLYFVPLQQIQADTTTTGDVRTSSASISVPVGWAYASSILGGILLILGLMIPAVSGVKGVRGPRGRAAAKPKKAKRRKSRLAKGTTVTRTTRTSRSR